MTTTVSILIAFGVYLLGMIGIGIWSMRQTKGADDFFLGGRGLSAPVAAMSAQASDMSGWLLMGLPGAIFLLCICTWNRAGMDRRRTWTWNDC